MAALSGVPNSTQAQSGFDINNLWQYAPQRGSATSAEDSTNYNDNAHTVVNVPGLGPVNFYGNYALSANPDGTFNKYTQGKNSVGVEKNLPPNDQSFLSGVWSDMVRPLLPVIAAAVTGGMYNGFGAAAGSGAAGMGEGWSGAAAGADPTLAATGGGGLAGAGGIASGSVGPYDTPNPTAVGGSSTGTMGVSTGADQVGSDWSQGIAGQAGQANAGGLLPAVQSGANAGLTAGNIAAGSGVPGSVNYGGIPSLINNLVNGTGTINPSSAIPASNLIKGLTDTAGSTGVGGLLSGLASTAGSLAPGIAALAYANKQPGFDPTQINSILANMQANAPGYIQAAQDPLKQAQAAGYGNMVQSQSNRGIYGSSFGDTSIGNFLNTTGRGISDAGINANQTALNQQGNLATNLAGLNVAQQNSKNNMYGRALGLFGNSLSSGGSASTGLSQIGSGLSSTVGSLINAMGGNSSSDPTSSTSSPSPTSTSMPAPSTWQYDPSLAGTAPASPLSAYSANTSGDTPTSFGMPAPSSYGQQGGLQSSALAPTFGGTTLSQPTSGINWATATTLPAGYNRSPNGDIISPTGQTVYSPRGQMTYA